MIKRHSFGELQILSRIGICARSLKLKERKPVAKGEIVDGIATMNGKNVFHEISQLQSLVPAYAGYSTMCWENPAGAGELQEAELNAAANAFVQRATQILWTRIYQHLFETISRNHKSWSKQEVDQEIQMLVAGMDLWT
jgi:hypothetical protein